MDFLIIGLLCISIILNLIILIKKSSDYKSTTVQDKSVDNSLLFDLNNTVHSSLTTISDKINVLNSDLNMKMLEIKNVLNDSLTESHKLDSVRTNQLNQALNQILNQLNSDLKEIQSTLDKNLMTLFTENRENQKLQYDMIDTRLTSFSQVTNQSLSEINSTVNRDLTQIQKDNNDRLEEMRKLVDDKLQETLTKRMNESFALVSERLEQVYKGLGEMTNLAQGVGDLKKVLTNVKNRGIIGEYQLGAILENILSPEQYDTNVATIPNSSEFVEYAVKLPVENGDFVYLPIDSKFPGDTYANLREAYDSGDKNLIDECVKKLISTLKAEAKDIKTKYIQAPYTTDFGIMFLPFEGLYSEVVSRGMVEVLQREYNVNIAGPSTMAALLNSLQMSFRTIAIQKRSGEVWNVLGAVKSEFEKFEDCLIKTQKNLNKTSEELDLLVGRRTRALRRKLKGVSELSEVDTQKVLDSVEDGEVD